MNAPVIDRDQLSPGQSAALQKVVAWIEDPKAPQIFRLFGYAGTGKTTLAKIIAKALGTAPLYCAYTGKAALVMQRNGCAGAMTIHSAIYRPIEMPDGTVEYVLNEEGPASDAGLIIVDEVSMVDHELARDLMSFGAPILVLGDPAQLPPVKGLGYFTEAEPDAMLTEIHRQAATNPIIQAATAVRQGRDLSYGDWGEGKLRILPRGSLDATALLEADQVIVGKNQTRHDFNRRLRAAKGWPDPMPRIGDKLVCLKNKRDKGLLNGGLFTVRNIPSRKAQKDTIRLTVQSEDFPDRMPQAVQVRREFFFGGLLDLHWKLLKYSDHFDYGYALTCHKAQGSQWDHVILYDESSVFREDARRWLYTGITRASERLTLVM